MLGNPLVFLFVVLLYYILRPVQCADRLQLSVTPDKTDEGVTTDLTINCTFSPSPTNKFAALLSIIISRQPSHGDQNPQELATVSSFDKTHPVNVAHLAATYSGVITDTLDGSYLSLHWTQPGSTEAGVYMCEANVLDDTGHPHKLTKSSVVQEQVSQLQQYLSLIQGIDSQVKSAEACCTSLTQKVSDLELTRTRLTLALAHVERSLLFEKSNAYKDGTVYYMSNYTVEDADTAQAVCEIMNGYLAEIQDAEELKFVTTVFTTTVPQRVLLGGRDDKMEGQWFWTHSNTPITFTAFKAGEPNSSGGDEDCLELNVIGGKWNDIPCAKLTDKGPLSAKFLDHGKSGPDLRRYVCGTILEADWPSMQNCNRVVWPGNDFTKTKLL